MRTCQQQQFYNFTLFHFLFLRFGEQGGNTITEHLRCDTPDTLQSPWERRMWIIGNIAKITIRKRTFTWGLKTFMSWALVKQLKFSHGTWSYNIYSYRILSSPAWCIPLEREEIRSLGLYLRYTSSYHLQIFNYNVYSALLLILHVFLFHVSPQYILKNLGVMMGEYYNFMSSTQ